MRCEVGDAPASPCAALPPPRGTGEPRRREGKGGVGEKGGGRGDAPTFSYRPLHLRGRGRHVWRRKVERQPVQSLRERGRSSCKNFSPSAERRRAGRGLSLCRCPRSSGE